MNNQNVFHEVSESEVLDKTLRVLRALQREYKIIFKIDPASELLGGSHALYTNVRDFKTNYLITITRRSADMERMEKKNTHTQKTYLFFYTPRDFRNEI